MDFELHVAEVVYTNNVMLFGWTLLVMAFAYTMFLLLGRR